MTNSLFIVHDEKKYFPERMSYASLSLLVTDLQTAVDKIKSQLAEGDRHVNAAWVGRAKDALEIKQKQIKQLERLMRNLKNRRSTLPDVFLEVAYDELPRTQFNQLMSFAREKLKSRRPSRSNGIDEWIGPGSTD